MQKRSELQFNRGLCLSYRVLFHIKYTFTQKNVLSFSLDQQKVK